MHFILVINSVSLVQDTELMAVLKTQDCFDTFISNDYPTATLKLFLKN